MVCLVRQTPSYSTSNVELSHAKRPDSVAEAQNMCSTGEYEFIVGQTSSYWPSNVQLSNVKRLDSVAEAQCTCCTGEYAFIVGKTPSYSPSNVQLSHAKRPCSVAEDADARTCISEDRLIVASGIVQAPNVHSLSLWKIFDRSSYI